MRTLDMLKQLAEQKVAGPTPSFTGLHLAEAIEIIGRELIGRLGLSERLGLGEGRPSLGSKACQHLKARMRANGQGANCKLLVQTWTKLGPRCSLAPLQSLSPH